MSLGEMKNNGIATTHCLSPESSDYLLDWQVSWLSSLLTPSRSARAEQWLQNVNKRIVMMQ